ncbi:MAG: phosphotransferase [Proteobacteria bacterium]|nr:phosphotransferase [Pseudomonadota bacterium]
MLELPETPEQLTSEWLSRALGWPIRSVEQQILGEGQGFLGDIVRLRLTSVAAEAPDSVVAKLPKKANRGVGEMLGVYEREILFFEDLAAQVPARTPQIYFSRFDRDAGSEKQKQILKAFNRLPRFLIPLVGAIGARVAAGKNRKYLMIMEDLGHMEMGDQLEGASVERCHQILTHIAGTHRAFWDSERLQDKFWLLPMDIDSRMRHWMFKKSLPAFQKIATPEMQVYLDWLGANSASLMTSFTRDAPHTLIHCDLRLDNVCFDSDRCAYFDWQLTRVGPAAYDVAYFLGGALLSETTASEERDLLCEYHRELDIPNYPFESLWRDYQRALMLTIPSLSPTEDLEIDPGRGQQMMSRWLERLTSRLQNVELSTLL